MSYCYLAFRTNVLLNLCCPGHLSYYSPHESEPLLSYLPRIKYFGLPFSVKWPVYRNFNDEESSLSIGLKLIYISSVRIHLFCKFKMAFTCTKSKEKGFGYHQK